MEITEFDDYIHDTFFVIFTKQLTERITKIEMLLQGDLKRIVYKRPNNLTFVPLGGKD